MQKDSIDRFIARLETLGGFTPEAGPDRQALAALRRSLATWPAIPPDAMRVVAPFLPQQDTGWREIVHYLIGGLFALHPCLRGEQAGQARSLGMALREALSHDARQSPERLLLALLNSKNEDLPNHLRLTVSYLRARKVTIDYRRLMQDLFQWAAAEHYVQRRWGRDFWGGPFEQGEHQQKSEETE